MGINDYKAPLVEAIEVKVQSVLCQSSGNDRGEFSVTGNDPIIDPEE